MIWYGDNGELKGIWDAPIPDILLFGGIALEREQADAIKSRLFDLKSGFRKEADFPIKWNFKDLKPWYHNRGLDALYERLLAESKEWRTWLIKSVLSIDFNIIASCVLFYSKKIEKIKENKGNVIKYTFCNALMRVGLHAQEVNASQVEVVLDWPEGSNHTPYTEEYRSAYQYGSCHAAPEIKYYSGPLKNLGFDEALYFTRMEDSTLSLGKKTLDHLGVELTQLLISKYRGFPGRIIGRGLSVAPADGAFSKKLFDAMIKLRK
jgi:hypothetical protein